MQRISSQGRSLCKMASTTQATKFLKDVVQHISSKTGYGSWIKQSVNVISGGNGSCVCEMTLRDEHVNVRGHLHGGCAATLVDVISTMALMTSAKAIPGVSVELSVSYLKSAKLGEDIIIDAKTLRAGNTLAFLSVDIKKKEDGSLIAVGKHVKFIGQNPPESPPKNRL